MFTINPLTFLVFLAGLCAGINFWALAGAIVLAFLTSIATGCGTKMGEDLWLKIKQWCA